MTADYPFVDIERQEQLTRAIQDRPAKAGEDKPAFPQELPSPAAPRAANPAPTSNPPLQQMRAAITLVQ